MVSSPSAAIPGVYALAARQFLEFDPVRLVFQPQELGLEMQERDRELLLKVALKVAHRKAVAGG
jgi:hypothetical protein